MSINSTSSTTDIGADSTLARELRVDGAQLDALINLGEQQLLQLKKVVLLLSAIAGMTVDDAET